MDDMELVTCTAPVNIAVIKYWGKRDEERMLPTNSSLSVTLNQADLKTTTTAMSSKSFTSDRLWLNGEERKIGTRERRCIERVRELTGRTEFVHIASVNNFPTAAGLASSAAGFACLAFTVAQLFGLKEQYPGQLSSIARLGSGSACRSLDSGWVKWNMGVAADGADSIAEQVCDDKHWPGIHIFILVASAEKKKVPSSAGMQTTVETSDLLPRRLDPVVPERMKQMEQAIRERDFEAFGKLTMRDSNQFHSVCLDTYPPIFYLNETSKAVIHTVHAFNDAKNGVKAAYTFDAGPNAVVFVQDPDVPDFLATVLKLFPSTKPMEQFFTKPTWMSTAYANQSLVDKVVSATGMDPQQNLDGVQQIIHTTPGPGPQVLGIEASLLNTVNGEVARN